jgi:Secretion system C-terminal sorting domain/Leucine Rich repeats (2 copies)
MIFTNFTKYCLRWIVLWCLMPQWSFGQAAPAGMPACLKADFDQLANFYNNTGGANWKTSTNWLTNPDLRTWHGITLTPDGCHVQAIELPNNLLTGSLPALELPELTNLSLNNNGLTGDILNFFEAGTPKLQHLSLSNNLFTGFVPNLSLQALTYLDFYNNQLTGTIPFFNLPNLRYLILANNQLTGSIPPLNCPFLIDLAVSRNQLSGNIPDFDLPSLKILWLKQNKFTFGDMEGKAWLKNALDTRVYSPQAIIPTAYDHNQLSVNVGGDLKQEIFKWYQDNVLVSTLEADNVFLPSEKGTYHCVITHAGLPELTLTSQDTFINCYTEPTTTYHTILQGESFTVNGHTYTATGVYYDTIAHPVVCDDVVITNLTVTPIDCHHLQTFTTIAQGVNQLDCQATSEYAGNFLYSWSTGETTPYIETHQAGIYTVTVTDGQGCMTTVTALNVPTFQDSTLCVRVDSSYTITLPAANLPNLVYNWYHNDQFIDTTHRPSLTISGLQHLDTGGYTVRFVSPVPNAQLDYDIISIPVVTLRNCCFSQTATYTRTIRQGTGVFWGSINRTESGVYTETLLGKNYMGCDSFRILTLTVVPCTVELGIAQLGDKLTANAIKGFSPYTYEWSNQDTTRFITIASSDNYNVTVKDSLGCTASTGKWYDVKNGSYRLDSTSIGCQEKSGCTPVVLARNINNMLGYTIRVKFDPSKVQPDTVINHTLGSMLPAGTVVYQQITKDSTLVVIISLEGVQNIDGKKDSTLICLSWQPAPSGSPQQPAIELQGVIEAAHAIGGQSVDSVRSTIKIVPEGIIQFAVLYQGTTKVTNSTDNNPTTVLTGTRGQFGVAGAVSNTGSYTLPHWKNDSIQFSRKSVLGTGFPEIGSFDVHKINLVIANDPSAERNVSKLLSMDVNGDGIINSGDLTLVRRRVIDDGIGFVQANLTKNSVAWRHFPQSYLTERPNFQLSTTYPEDDFVGISRHRVPRIDSIFHPHLNVSCTQQSMPIVAILLGDADGSAGQNLIMDDKKGKLSNRVTIDIKQATVSHDTFRIPVYATEAMMGLDCSFENYSKMMQIIGVTTASPDILILSRIDTTHKKCLISAFTPQASGIAANKPLYYLTVKAACPYDSYFGKVTPYLNGVLTGANMNTSCNVGTTETAVNTVNVFPNPTNDWLTVTYDNLPATIQVFNVMGGLLKTVAPSDKQTSIDVSELMSGIYFLKVNNQMLKFIKQ